LTGVGKIPKPPEGEAGFASDCTVEGELSVASFLVNYF
jgi:hypothetical protein